MENPEVAQVFEEVADLLEIQGANPFRVRAYRNAARTIRDLGGRLADMLCDPARKLDELAGIGKDLAGKIQTICETGDLPLRKELQAELPAGLRELLHVPGLGPKKAALLFKERNITSIAELKAAAQQGRIRDIRGFGARTEEKILQVVDNVQEGGKRVLLAEAKIYADAVVRHLQDAPGVRQIEVAGSYRRRKESVGDLDVLVTCDDADVAMDRLAAFEAISKVEARGDTKMTVALRNGMQMDLRVVPERSYGAALMYFTGSKAHNILIRKRAQDRGLKLNEYGVFRGERFVAGRTEAEVYKKVDLPWIPPELREDRGEIQLALDGRLPRLIEATDLRGDLHMHTTATDGRATLDEMVQAAKKKGYKYIAITDHSKRVTMARGLDARRLRQEWKEIDRYAAKTRGITILKGVELDILENGELDLPDDVLKEADWVVASIHYGQNQPRERITQRLLNAIKNPYVRAIGHLTGRLIGRRQGMELDLDTVLKAAADHGCFMELNSQPDRLDLDDVALMAAKDRGVKIVIDTDAHAVEELGFMEFGIYQARRARLEAKDVVNTRSLTEFKRIRKG
jgi:DNA polymerase (family 10)